MFARIIFYYIDFYEKVNFFWETFFLGYISISFFINLNRIINKELLRFNK